MQEAVQPWLAPHLVRIVNQLNTKNWAKVTVKLPNGVLAMRVQLPVLRSKARRGADAQLLVLVSCVLQGRDGWPGQWA